MEERKQKDILEAKKTARKYTNMICIIFSIILFFVMRELFNKSRDRREDLLVFLGICLFEIFVMLVIYVTIYNGIFKVIMYDSFKEEYLSNSKFIEVMPIEDEYLIGLSKVSKFYATMNKNEIVIYIKFKIKNQYYEHKRYDITDFYKEFYIRR